MNLEPIAWHCVNIVTGKMLYTDSEDAMKEMREANAKHWQVTPLYSQLPVAAAAPAVAVPEGWRDMAQYIVDNAVHITEDSNGPDCTVCDCCLNEVPHRRGAPIAELTHKDDCLFVRAQAMLAAAPRPGKEN